MKHFFLWFFAVLGVIFTLQLIALAYIWFADPFHIRALFVNNPPSTFREESASLDTGPTVSLDEPVTVNRDEASAPATPTPVPLTAAQEDALELVGINPAALPTEISPEQLTCFERVLGASRVAEIKSGAVPTITEMFAAETCL
jgi:hypothetical protein